MPLKNPIFRNGVAPVRAAAPAAALFGTLEIKILSGFLLAISLLLFGGAYTYRTSVQMADSLEWVAHSQEVRATLAGLYGSLAGADRAERDYLLTGQRVRLDDYVRLVNDVRDDLTSITRLTNDNPAQRRNWAALQSAVATRFNNMAAALVAYRHYGLPAARAVLSLFRLTGDSEGVRTVVDRMDAVEVRLLTERHTASVNVRRTTLISLVITIALASAIFIALFRAAHREMRARSSAENELLESNGFLDSLIENLPVMVFVKDARTLRYVRHNRASLELLGLSPAEVIGKIDADFLPPEQADFVLAKDREVLDAGRQVDIPEQRIESQHLGTRILHTMKMPILDERGEPKFLLGISSDITASKLAEQALLELNAELRDKTAQLEATNKELDSFSYSVSHDLRAPLRAIDGFAQMMEEDYQERLDAEGRRYLSVIRQNSTRMGALIDNLLEFSRLGRQPVAVDEVDVDALVREVVEEVLNSAARADRGEDAAAPQIDVGPLPPARGDRGLLRQVWSHLIANAVKYSGKVQRPFIQISGREAGAENHYTVRDNGVGFNMQYVEQLFRVFQRLHHADEFAGTGVGLALVQRIVTKHGGRVWAEGVVNGGAVFSFALPKGESQ